MFNKSTGVAYYGAGKWPEEQTTFFQRDGEPGLSQRLRLTFDGPWCDEERQQVAEIINDAFHRHALL